ncbi:5-(carboxyamino)imidazole ribonucleotide synthase [Alkaliphilus peptidifermentans]|uniref:N5-carboxyaminoimidazole ribonucleotide synthase n=1 Tax=Alkaliphilus peptidifermentans DSM 18978 TaxID=1120976 RepID=A0A1G5I993_9FIRM|nr:5-(carboxyamino)imidazole ribonucleotide synthase [Alkaliphilus peptidifermentans]SCY72584.1 5-(carboxyamino)imidazole ribonucleotide synthase [Alkaliphilus peptidifermentans DSM 18978]
MLRKFNDIKIGIIGGGQLGKMMAIEGKKLGLKFIILDPQPDCPAATVVDELIIGSFYDEIKIKELANKTDVVTYEFEHIHADLLKTMEQEGYKIYPSPSTLKIIQDKYQQKKFLTEQGLPVPKFKAVTGLEDLNRAVMELGLPILLKSRRGGYDGKGNYLIKTMEEIEIAYKSLGGKDDTLMVEAFVDFEMEVSAIVARGIYGDQKVYPLSENIHEDNILITTIVPARVKRAIEEKAKAVAQKSMEVLGGIGVFCIEMFIDREGNVLVNEIAPRVHNSGHYTIEGCSTSQFAQHLRGILGLPLGSTNLRKSSVMINLLGDANSKGTASIIGVEKVLKESEAYLHIYGKKESKPQRKMGHVTVLDSDINEALGKAQLIRGYIKIIGEEAEYND